MKIGLIADEFTRVCLELENGVEVINLTPNNYLLEVGLKNLDLILIESAWLGIAGTWKGRVALYEKQKKIKHISLLAKIGRLKNIPVVFWNKEDPVGFERFKHQIEHVDICLTTDEKKVDEYKKILKPKQKVDVQNFFFQPKLHNPKTVGVDKALSDKVIFCGGYYQQEYPDRVQRLNDGIQTIGSDKIVIYDRFTSGASSWKNYGEGKKLNVKAAFNYKDSKYYYQQGCAHLNVNSLDGLTTMFSRRMLELIACNQKVIDLTNYKNKSLLSEFVIQAGSKDEIEQSLLKDKPDIDFQYLLSEFSVNCFINKLKTII